MGCGDELRPCRSGGWVDVTEWSEGYIGTGRATEKAEKSSGECIDSIRRKTQSLGLKLSSSSLSRA